MSSKFNAFQLTFDVLVVRMYFIQVEVEVEQCDKGGNFIGWLYYDGKNLSTSLVSEGLCKLLPQAERSVHAKELFDMEEKAKAARKKLWKVC